MCYLLWPPIPSLPAKAPKPSVCPFLFLFFCSTPFGTALTKRAFLLAKKNTGLVLPVFPHLWRMIRGVRQQHKRHPRQSKGSNFTTPASFTLAPSHHPTLPPMTMSHGLLANCRCRRCYDCDKDDAATRRRCAAVSQGMQCRRGERSHKVA